MKDFHLSCILYLCLLAQLFAGAADDQLHDYFSVML